jgi:hypothetical protein
MPRDTQHVKEQKKKRDLERKVLAHLKRCGASLYDALYVRFDLTHTAKIKPVLYDLKEYGYIEVATDKMVTITTFGLHHLEEKA